MNESTITSDLSNLLDDLADLIKKSFNCHQIGKLSSINDNQTCEVELQIQKEVDDTTVPNGKRIVSYTVLADVPYFVPGGGQAYIDIPYQVGDYCLVMFNDTSFDLWWSQEQKGVPLNKRRHSLADGIAFPGICPSSKPRKMDGDKLRIIGKSGQETTTLSAAARLDDEVKSTNQEDTTFWNWVQSITAKVNSLALGNKEWPGGIPGPLPLPIISVPTPSDLTGKITSASEEVEIS